MPGHADVCTIAGMRRSSQSRLIRESTEISWVATARPFVYIDVIVRILQGISVDSNASAASIHAQTSIPGVVRS